MQVSTIMNTFLFHEPPIHLLLAGKQSTCKTVDQNSGACIEHSQSAYD